MKRLLSRLQDPLPHLLLAPSRKKFDDANSKLTDYLQAVTAPAVLTGVDDVLSPLLESGVIPVDQLFEQYAIRDADHDCFWQKTTFDRFAAEKFGDHEILTSYSSVLWHMFCGAANYPFAATASLTSMPDSISEEDVRLDLQAFRRACALLVLRGWELFPSDDDRDGSRQYGPSERASSDKVSQLARAIFKCMSVSISRPRSEPSMEQDTWEVEIIRNTLIFVHPRRPEAPNIRGATFKPASFVEHFDSAAKRLLQDGDVQSDTTSTTASLIAMDDLRQIMHLLLLVRQGDKVWRTGRASQQTSDVCHAQLDLSNVEITQASCLAANMLTRDFRSSAEYVPLEQFTKWASENVRIPPRSYSTMGRLALTVA
nr:hypothetical protein CFP56_64703 [Quercus suber]